MAKIWPSAKKYINSIYLYIQLSYFSYPLSLFDVVLGFFWHLRCQGLVLLVNLTLNFLSRSVLVTHFNACLLLKSAYTPWALWWIFLHPADLHFLNVFSTTLLASFCSIYVSSFSNLCTNCPEKRFFCSYTKNRQRRCENSSIFPIVCP